MAITVRPAFALLASRISTAAHLFALITLILVLVWTIHFGGGLNVYNTDNPDLIFNVHPVVMTLGFILVVGEGIMVHKIIPVERQVRKTIHMMLQLVAIVLGIFGVWVAFKFHRVSEIPHMYTLHSWLGLITIIFFGLQWMFGFMLFWYPRAPLPTRAMMAPLHAAFGLGIFLMTICTAETGFVQKGTDPGTETRVINFTAFFLFLFGVSVCLSTILPRVMTI